jgi:SAM-dependent methyltransferase
MGGGAYAPDAGIPREADRGSVPYPDAGYAHPPGPQPSEAEAPALGPNDVTPIPHGGPPAPPPFGQSSPPIVDSTMDTPPAVDLASARAQAYDDDDGDTEDLASDRSAASSQTAGEIVTGFDAADALPDDALEDVLDEEESPVPRKIVVDARAGQPAPSTPASASEEELDTVDIIDADAPHPRPTSEPPVPSGPPGAPPVPQEPPPRREAASAPAKAPPAPKGPPPAPRSARKSEPGRASETASALAQLEVEREVGRGGLFERAAKEAATGAWFEEAFGDHYAALTRTGHPAEAKAEIEFFLQSTGLQPGASVLDVGSGDGAHALVLAQRGYAATGFDSSLPQLLRATQANEALGAGVRFLHGDMRDPPVEGPFDGILCLGTTLGFFHDEDNRKAIRKLRDRLAPGGRAMIQVFNRDHVVARLPARSWWQGHGCLVLDEAEMNYFTNRLQVHRTVVFEDGRQFAHDISVRAYTAHDLGTLCVDAGLRVLELSGSRLTRGRFYGATSPEIWLLVERP